MNSYYKAYDQRYRQVHDRDLQWSSDVPSPIVSQVMEEFSVASGNRILEIGCGEGRDAIHLLRRGYDVLATDVSPEAIGWCRGRMPEYAEAFQVLDCLQEDLHEPFDLIYAVAVVHMLVRDEDRDGFYRFLRRHLKPGGIALVCSMGDGTMERSTDIRRAFDLQQRTHGQSGQTMELAATSCRMVTFPTFHHEIRCSGLSILKSGLTSVEPDFPVMMYAVVSSNLFP